MATLPFFRFSHYLPSEMFTVKDQNFISSVKPGAGVGRAVLVVDFPLLYQNKKQKQVLREEESSPSTA